MIKAILLDIEGTTTPIDFVHKTLFPYARAKIGDFVHENLNRIGAEISRLKIEHAEDTAYFNDFVEDSPESISEYLHFLIDCDRKSTSLKSFQGKIWQIGYKAGDLRSEVFDDVLPSLERWKSGGKTIAIYSSGSVLAQQLLFRYSDHGDLTILIDNYFDTATGGKREAESYEKIAHNLGRARGEVLFVSDVVPELDSAREAGMATTLSVRPGNAAITGVNAHSVVRSFDELPV